jgi:predicted dehydrogenase
MVIVGCGHISAGYAETLKPHAEIELLGAQDLDPQRAQDFCSKFGGRAYATLEEVLADPRVEGVINLTIHHAHAEVVRRCLTAGKHVHTEKPLAMTTVEAQGLVELARRQGLQLTSSPITYLGEAQQTAFRYIRQGYLGEIKLVFAEVNHGRIESWHPNPAPFYDVGVVFDVGVYPIALLTALLGPVRSVSSWGRVLLPERRTLSGQPFAVKYPDYVCTQLEFAQGTVARLTTDFYVEGKNSKQAGVEFHGDKGSLVLGHWFSFDASVEASAFGEPLQSVPLVKEPYKGGAEWARGPLELAKAVREKRRPRASGEHAAHVVEITEAIGFSVAEKRTVAVQSTFERPEPMDWAR